MYSNFEEVWNERDLELHAHNIIVYGELRIGDETNSWDATHNADIILHGDKFSTSVFFDADLQIDFGLKNIYVFGELNLFGQIRT